MKTNAYIDGFNLYYGCLKGTPHRWLDLAAFCQTSFPPQRNQINRIRYFTAYVNARPNNPQQRVRQKFGKKALVMHPRSHWRTLSVELRRVASKSLIVDASLLPTSQFPAMLTDAHGTIHKPARW